jgi:hypothetical protein
VPRRLGLVRRQEPLAALVQPAGWLGAGQGDDAAALGLGEAPGQARPGQVGQPVQPLGSVEAVQPLVHRLGVAAEPLGELGDAGAVPAAVMMRARWIRLAGAWRALASLRKVRSSAASVGGRAYSGGLGMCSPSPAQRRHDEHNRQANYTALKERSTSSTLLGWYR